MKRILHQSIKKIEGRIRFNRKLYYSCIGMSGKGEFFENGYGMVWLHWNVEKKHGDIEKKIEKAILHWLVYKNVLEIYFA